MALLQLAFPHCSGFMLRRCTPQHQQQHVQHTRRRSTAVLAFIPSWIGAASHSIVELAEEVSATGGPIELPSEADGSQASPVQIGASIVLTGTIAVLLFRSIRRRFKQAKGQKLRASSAKEQVKTSILEKLSKDAIVENPPPSIQQTVYGALLAAALAFVMYQLTTAIDANFASRPVTTTNYSIRNITITVRTIISGICYLATFIFAADAIGLTLYGLQLAISPPQDQRNQKEEVDSPRETSKKE